MELWPTFNFENNLPSGFLKTGIYPYDPAVIWSTIPQKSLPRPDENFSFKKTFESQLTGARKSLSEIYMFCESYIDQIMTDIVKRGEGKSHEKIVDVVEEFRAAVFETRPEKRPKDTRLPTDAGLTLTEAEYVNALRARKDSQKKKQKGASKKRALQDISNTPQKCKKVTAKRFSCS